MPVLFVLKESVVGGEVVKERNEGNEGNERKRERAR
jgi:hypothetical protein